METSIKVLTVVCLSLMSVSMGIIAYDGIANIRARSQLKRGAAR